MFPGIDFAHETVVDLYLDIVSDLTLHPLYNQRGVAQGPREGRMRGRSLPTHRLDMNIPESMNLEADSLAPSEFARNHNANEENVDQQSQVNVSNPLLTYYSRIIKSLVDVNLEF